MVGRVRAGQRFRFEPCLLDQGVLGKVPYGVERGLLKRGDVVKVVALPGCPPPGTMRMCHIEKDGAFAGLVSLGSLQPLDAKTKNE